MCGVPAHASQNYLSRLINQGHKVAIAEQLENEQTEDSSINTKRFLKEMSLK